MNKEALLAQMNGRSITNGWDVVCAMSAERISKLFEEKYKSGEYPGNLREIKHSENFILGCISFDFKLGPPLISFIKDDPTRCTIRLEILSGLAEVKDKSGAVVDSQNIPSGPGDTNKYYINSIIPLAVIQGRVENGQDVVINFNQTQSVQIDLIFDDTINEYARNAMKNYFANDLEKKDWSLGTLIFKDNPQLIHLTPKAFEFATSVREGDGTDKGCLLLFITTINGKRGNDKELIGNAGRIYIPYPDDRSAALIISSELLFAQILCPQFKEHISQNISAKCDSTSLPCSLNGSGSLDCGRYDKIQKQNIQVPLDSFSVFSNVNNVLQIAWAKKWNNLVQYKHTVHVRGDVYDEISDGDVELEISVNNPTYSFSVQEPGQVINCSSSAAINVSGKEPSFWDGYGFSHAKEMVKSRVERSIGGILSFQLKGVDIFAVSNLLFPADHVIAYDTNGVYVPGDLVIFGSTNEKLKVMASGR